ncbi:MAG: glycosyltransferase family 2 protein [Hyphomicrobiales bacterium]|nr:glycosyltransferase family 2 protein [Hyphomicrobiales bacterium]
MNVTFIVTTYNVLPYIDACIASLSRCVKDNDVVLIVDDGSTDGTAQYLERLEKAQTFPGNIELVLLGANSFGGVAIPANIGLSQALENPDCDIIFLVDGDDWLDPAGFAAGRAQFENHRPDILCGNYLLYDDVTSQTSRPADLWAWRQVHAPGQGGLENRRVAALDLISVPWRKFYRADFLKDKGLRFPEGDFFYEDNPFHWDVCLQAGSIDFLDRVLCFHRINHPGQTMGETGYRLVAFFDHFDAIIGSLRSKYRDPWSHPLAVNAVVWLLTNMTWHLERLDFAACRPYAERCRAALCTIPEDVWKAASGRFDHRNPVARVGDAIRSGGPGSIALHWEINAIARDIRSALESIRHSAAGFESALETIDSNTRSLHEIARFQSLLGLLKP